MNPGEIIILAGGPGTRLSAVSQGMPKCLVNVGGNPFLYYLINYYKGQSIRKFIFSLGYGHEKVIEYLNRSFPDLEHELVIENQPLDTGGATISALKLAVDNTVLVVNGDTYFRISLSSMAGFHHMCGAECTIAIKEVTDTTRFGTINLNRDYSVSSFSEKGQPGPGLINGGAYLINRRLFMDHDFPEKFSLEKDYLQQYYDRSRIFGVKQNGFFIDIGVPEDLDRAQLEIPMYESGLDQKY